MQLVDEAGIYPALARAKSCHRLWGYRSGQSDAIHTVTALHKLAEAHRPAFSSPTSYPIHSPFAKINSAYVTHRQGAGWCLEVLAAFLFLATPRDGHYADKELGNAQNLRYPHNYPQQLGQSGLLAWTSSNTLPYFIIPNENGRVRACSQSHQEKIDLN